MLGIIVWMGMANKVWVLKGPISRNMSPQRRNREPIATRDSYYFVLNQELTDGEVRKLKAIVGEGEENGDEMQRGIRIHAVTKGELISPFSGNAVEIVPTKIQRVEKGREYWFSESEFTGGRSDVVKWCQDYGYLDALTETDDEEEIGKFGSSVRAETSAERINEEVLPIEWASVTQFCKSYGLPAFHEQELSFYRSSIFRSRRPNSIELFDLAQANSEHCRHWFFKGNISIEGDKDLHQSLVHSGSLLGMIRKPLIALQRKRGRSENSVIAFNDNSSGIKGFEKVPVVRPTCPIKVRTEGCKSTSRIE